eukprot:gene16123-23788_t
MDKYGGSKYGGGGGMSSMGGQGAPQDAQIQQQIAQLEQQVNGEHVKMMVTLQQNTCFKKCVTSPSSSLSRGEQECIANCVDRFNESFEFVTSTFLSAQQGGR